MTPYKNYLSSRGKDFYKQAIGEIMELFDRQDFMRDSKLEGEFLLGYHHQKMEIARQIAEHSAKSQSSDANE